MPLLALSVCPACAVPEISGGARFNGAVTDVPTTALGSELTEAKPPAFDAVTTTLSVFPTSPDDRPRFPA